MDRIGFATVMRPGTGVNPVLRLEWAASWLRRARGLMGRKRLDEGVDGMLFVYPRPRRVRFWMMGMRMPIDMVFVDPEGRISRLLPDRAPGSCTPQDSGGGVRWVVELAAGRAQRLGLRVGDRLVFASPAARQSAQGDTA